MILPALLALVAAQSAGGHRSTLPPATAAAILAGGKACLGATSDPAGEDARLAGWVDATPVQKAGLQTHGRVVTRDHVLLIVNTGADGGCVIQANFAPGLDQATFLRDLGTAIGAPVVTDAKNPVTNLPNGEVLVTLVKDNSVMLAFANHNGKHFSNSRGKQ